MCQKSNLFRPAAGSSSIRWYGICVLWESHWGAAELPSRWWEKISALRAQTGSRVSKAGSESWAMINIIASSPRAAELPLRLVTVRMTSDVRGLCAERKCDRTDAGMKVAAQFLDTWKTRQFILEILYLYFCNVEQNNASISEVLGTWGLCCCCYTGRWTGIGPTHQCIHRSSHPVVVLKVLCVFWFGEIICCAFEWKKCFYIKIFLYLFSVKISNLKFQFLFHITS